MSKDGDMQRNDGVGVGRRGPASATSEQSRVTDDRERTRAGGRDEAWSSFTLALRAWIATRVMLVAFTIAAALIATIRHAPHGWSPGDLLQQWYQFDVVVYTRIAQDGYAAPVYAAFFPLYPLLVRGGVLLFGPASALIFAMLISNGGTLLAFWGFIQLARDEGYDLHATRFGLLALAAYPFAFFLGAGYSEGPFLACAAWGLWAMRRGYWYRAAGCALLLALCRPTGLILIAPLLYEFARRHGWLRRLTWSAIPQGLAISVAGPVGIGAYSYYCAQRYGDPLAWLHAQATYWHRPSVPIWQGVSDVATYFVSLPLFGIKQDRKLIDLLPLLAVLALTVVLARRQPVAFTLYLAGMLYITLASPAYVDNPSLHQAVYESAGRFMLTALPIFLALGGWLARAPRLAIALLSLSFGLQAALTIIFLSGGLII